MIGDVERERPLRDRDVEREQRLGADAAGAPVGGGIALRVAVAVRVERKQPARRPDHRPEVAVVRVTPGAKRHLRARPGPELRLQSGDRNQIFFSPCSPRGRGRVRARVLHVAPLFHGDMADMAVRAPPERRRVLRQRPHALQRRRGMTVGAAHGQLRIQRLGRVDRRQHRSRDPRRRVGARGMLQDLAVRDRPDDPLREDRAPARNAVGGRALRRRRRRHPHLGRRLPAGGLGGDRPPHRRGRVHRRDRCGRGRRELRVPVDGVGPQQPGKRIVLQPERPQVAEVEQQGPPRSAAIVDRQAEGGERLGCRAAGEHDQPLEPRPGGVFRSRPVLEREPGRRQDAGDADRIDDAARPLADARRARVARGVGSRARSRPGRTRRSGPAGPGPPAAAARARCARPESRARAGTRPRRRWRRRARPPSRAAGRSRTRCRPRRGSARESDGAAVAQPAGHSDLAAGRAVGAQRLAQAEHAGRRGDAPDAPARIVGRRRQAEQRGVREHAALGVDVPRDAGCRGGRRRRGRSGSRSKSMSTSRFQAMPASAVQ